MKRVFKVAIGLILAVALLSTMAFAAGSKTFTVKVTTTGTMGPIESGIPPLTVPIAAKASNISESGLSIPWQGDVKGTAGTDTITVSIPGYKGDIYVYHYENGAWVEIARGTGETMTVSPKEFSPFGIAIKAPASPKTGETVLPYVALGVAMIAAAAAVSIRRKEET